LPYQEAAKNVSESKGTTHLNRTNSSGLEIKTYKDEGRKRTGVRVVGEKDLRTHRVNGDEDAKGR